MSKTAAIIIGITSLFILYILCRVFIKPLKWFMHLAFSCLLGCLTMFAANKLLFPLGISFSLNPLTAMLGGVLGIPGMILTIILQCTL